MDTATPPQHEMVVCPVCWGEPISRAKWDSEGCCLTPREREEFQW